MNLDHHLPQTLHSFIEHSDTGTWMDSATAVALSAFFPWLSIFLASHVENRQACTATSINPADLTRTGRVTD